MKNWSRLGELKVLAYRLLLVFVFYQIARLLFYYYNADLLSVDSTQDLFRLCYYGTAFDTTAILYINSVFILLSILPLYINTKKGFQTFLMWWYFITNGIAYVLNFGDFVYFKFSQSRLTSAVFDVVGHETNLTRVFWEAIKSQPSIPICYIGLMILWIFLYKKVKIRIYKPEQLWKYFGISVLQIVVITVLVVGGIRGDFQHSTRPINMVDAGRHTKKPVNANLVLNSPFSLIRTIRSNGFKKENWYPTAEAERDIKTIKYYPRETPEKPNIVIFIMESFGKEYSGAFNKNTQIPDFVSYTPFLDSLAGKSLIFTEAYANGRQSIHGMSSVLCGIPSLKDAFTSSPYANQKIQSIVSVCNDMGYDTSFFHGAPNGSMGFLGFGNILGFNHYYGKTEYNNDDDYDGIWGIWDEPFFQYFAKTLNRKQSPFMATLFSVSSHHPFKIPEKYNGKFKQGKIPIHEPIEYSDFALKQFFKTAEKMPWYHNTIFVIVADHTNQVYYPEYQKTMNRFAIPILFFSPNENYNLHGEVATPAQQIDIYPTLTDLIGYNKPFRSWGRSLVQENSDEPNIIVNSTGVNNQFIINDYIYIFDGKDVIGIYKRNDADLAQNLISERNLPQHQKAEELVKKWFQDYNERIIDRNLTK
ncbi:LTA synthase family protein [Ornithobacterium rhinotracheale]|uniref:LTA synthase family protein n=1 Tax=Ornithobacterium rhinotracheale TaxID=28251 RepID=UPI00129CB2A3|nr:LTA synthase family protein [Ornithobacterium rhinotracheale]MRI63611.1 LTA synthase family protein [Ornithobacterium rhinotracheale]